MKTRAFVKHVIPVLAVSAAVLLSSGTAQTVHADGDTMVGPMVVFVYRDDFGNEHIYFHVIDENDDGWEKTLHDGSSVTVTDSSGKSVEAHVVSGGWENAMYADFGGSMELGTYSLGDNFSNVTCPDGWELDTDWIAEEGISPELEVTQEIIDQYSEEGGGVDGPQIIVPIRKADQKPWTIPADVEYEVDKYNDLGSYFQFDMEPLDLEAIAEGNFPDDVTIIDGDYQLQKDVDYSLITDTESDGTNILTINTYKKLEDGSTEFMDTPYSHFSMEISAKKTEAPKETPVEATASPEETQEETAAAEETEAAEETPAASEPESRSSFPVFPVIAVGALAAAAVVVKSRKK